MTQFFPSYDEFTAIKESGKHQFVFCKLPADLETPVLAAMRLKNSGIKDIFMLESVIGGEFRGRYSILAFDAEKIYENHKLDEMKAIVASETINYQTSENLPPIAPAIIGYMTYDMAAQFEPVGDSGSPDNTGIAANFFMRPRIVIIFDAVSSSKYILIRSRNDCEKSYQDLIKRLNEIEAIIEEPKALPKVEVVDKAIDFIPNQTKEEYFAKIEKVKEHILAGDIFQLVLSMRFRSHFPYPPFALYRSIRYLNPSPFLFYLEKDNMALIGSSPEILVRLRGGKVTIRPIAGTRKRGKDAAEDTALAEDLLGDKKEVAEHLMLLDLGRNDVGRVAKAGTVKVTEYMKIEHYSHVMHIVSNVEGDIADGKDAFDALLAGFPAGTVSGAPKVRAMQIIEQLEPEKRSFYAGTICYFSITGEMDSCIALRTALVKDGEIHVQAGGGVVADSTAEGEYQEIANKAMAMMKAAEMAKEFI